MLCIAEAHRIKGNCERDGEGAGPRIWVLASTSSNLITYLSLKLYMVHWAIKCSISKWLLKKEVDLFVLVTTSTKVYFFC